MIRERAYCITDRRCHKCGCAIETFNDPAQNMGEDEWCINPNCDFYIHGLLDDSDIAEDNNISLEVLKEYYASDEFKPDRKTDADCTYGSGLHRIYSALAQLSSAEENGTSSEILNNIKEILEVSAKTELKEPNTMNSDKGVAKKSEIKKTFKYIECKRCEYTCGCSHECRNCKEGSNLSELYDADPNCVHNVKPAGGGGVHCTKCKGWFCF